MGTNKKNIITRRDFLATGAVAATTISGFPFVRTSRAQSVKPLKVGLIGCGGRGTASLREALQAAPGIRVTALADPFNDRIERCLKSLKDTRSMKGLVRGVDVKPDHCFAGLDGY